MVGKFQWVYIFAIFVGQTISAKYKIHENSVPRMRAKTAHVLEAVRWPHALVIKVLNANFLPSKIIK